MKLAVDLSHVAFVILKYTLYSFLRIFIMKWYSIFITFFFSASVVIIIGSWPIDWDYSCLPDTEVDMEARFTRAGIQPGASGPDLVLWWPGVLFWGLSLEP